MHPWSPKDFKSKLFKSSGEPVTFEAFDFKNTSYFSIPRLYDSHIHLQGIGKFSGDHNLSHCRSLAEVKTQLEKLIPSGFHSPTGGLGYSSEALGSQTGAEHYLETSNRQTDFEPYTVATSGSPADSIHYVEAFGLQVEALNLKDLCQWATHTYPHVVFCLVLEDGHRALFTGGLLSPYSSLWIEDSDAASKRPDTKGGASSPSLVPYKNSDIQYIFSDTAKVIGVLVGDQLRPTFEARLSPKPSLAKSPLKLKQDLLTGQKILVQNGFTHCRDMTSDPLQFQTLLELERNKRFFIYTDLYFSNFKGESLEALLKQAQTYKPLSTPRGIKIFLDGTLSGNNLDCSCAKLSANVATYQTEDIYEILQAAHTHDLKVAFHCIGDLAFEKIILALKKLASHTKGHLPYTHFEHCEFINDQSLGHFKAVLIINFTFIFSPHIGSQIMTKSPLKHRICTSLRGIFCLRWAFPMYFLVVMLP